MLSRFIWMTYAKRSVDRRKQNRWQPEYVVQLLLRPPYKILQTEKSFRLCAHLSSHNTIVNCILTTHFTTPFISNHGSSKCCVRIIGALCDRQRFAESSCRSSGYRYAGCCVHSLMPSYLFPYLCVVPLLWTVQDPFLLRTYQQCLGIRPCRSKQNEHPIIPRKARLGKGCRTRLVDRRWGLHPWGQTTSQRRSTKDHPSRRIIRRIHEEPQVSSSKYVAHPSITLICRFLSEWSNTLPHKCIVSFFLLGILYSSSITLT